MPALEQILETAHGEGSGAVADRIFAAVESFARGVAQYDDQTLLVATRTAP